MTSQVALNTSSSESSRQTGEGTRSHNEKLGSFERDIEDLPTQSWEDDPQNPMNWASLRKWTTLMILIVTNFVAALCTSSFEPALPSVMADFHAGDGSSRDGSLAALTISIYVIGYCLGPLVVAPLSELYGHVIVLYPAYLLFMVALAVCGSSNNLPLFIIFRALMGFAAITFVLIGPAIVADLIPREKRGFALSIMSAGPVIGPTIGPIMGGYIVEKTSWRWTFWATLIAFFALFVFAVAFLKETYGPVLVQRKQKSSQTQPNIQLADLRQVLKAAWIRPLKMLCLPIVPFVAFYSALSNAYGLTCFATVGTVFQDNYHFSPGQSGLAYLGLLIGFVFCQLTLSRLSDKYMLRMEAKHHDKKPEYRLPPMLIGAFLLPVGFFWYGWSLQLHTHVSILKYLFPKVHIAGLPFAQPRSKYFTYLIMF
ncbi:hypothetical protein ACMFMG_007945 [Clarireedia jacksonii]